MTPTPRNTMDIGTTLVDLCTRGRNVEAIELLYADGVVSVEAGAPPGAERSLIGKDAVLAKRRWWNENHEVHAMEVRGPWPHDEQFIARFTFDVTFKVTGQRFVIDEAALYTVQDGHVVREAFFYSMG